MRRRWVVLTLVIALAAIAFLWWRRGSTGESTASPKSGSAARGSAAATHEAQRTANLLAWFTQPNVPARRIAGKVLANGAPAAGAVVRLALSVHDILEPVAVVKTAADGTFDLGKQPAADFVVSAEAANHAPVSVEVSTADPRSKPDQLLLALGDCHSRLYGSVVDASGGGIAKARLAVEGLGGADSDASGQYSLCMSYRMMSRIRVDADGYGSIVAPLRLNGELRYDFVLVPEAILVGRVVTQDDQPVPGAGVAAVPDPSEQEHHLATGWAIADRDGRFRITGLAPGKFELFARSDHVASETPTLAIARATKSSTEIRVVVTAVTRLTGHVMTSGQPVAGAQVAARRSGSSVPAYSQADGSFVLDGVPLGKNSFFARPFEVKTPVSIEITAATADVTIDVTKLASISGHVTRKGKPGTSAFIECNQSFGVAADISGAYRVEGLPAGMTRCFGWDSIEKAFQPVEVMLAAGEDKTVDIELGFAGEVKGIVVDEAAKPVAAAHVRMENDDGQGDFCDSMTDATGAFDCHSLSGGEYIVAVYPSPAATRAFEPATGDRLPKVTVPKDGVVTGITLAVKHKRLSITGTVTDDIGGRVTDVHIEAMSRGRGNFDLPSNMSDANGRFEIGDLSPGLYVLRAHSADGSETEMPDIAAGTKDVVIKMTRPGSIEGKLVGFTTPPMVHAHITTKNVQMAIVDGDSFSIVGLPPGRYSVSAKSTGGESDGATVDVRSGEVSRVTLKSRAVGRIEGRVKDHATGAPLAGMECTARLSVGGQMDVNQTDASMTSTTDAAGHFAMAAPFGRVRVFCAPNEPARSVAGTDVEVTTSIPNVELVSVKGTFGASPGDGGFDVTPLVLPLRVHAITPGGPAAAVDLKVGDTLVSIDGKPLQGYLPMGAHFLIQNHKPGSSLTLVVERGGVTHPVKIVVATAPD